MMRREAQVIVELAVKYGLEKKTLIETETSSVLIYVRSLNKDIGIYQTAYGDFERGMLICLNYGFTGISYKTNLGEELDKEKMDMLHRKGLKLIAWNLKSQAEVPGLIDIGVDYIQVDL
jgi:glycerophosphoryl diester phosphodiesterase